MAATSSKASKVPKPLCWKGYSTPPPVPPQSAWKEPLLENDHFWDKIRDNVVGLRLSSKNDGQYFCVAEAEAKKSILPDSSKFLRLLNEKRRFAFVCNYMAS